MTEEELRKDYYADRPSEPYSDDDRPSDWANIAHYAEENLENAFKRIEELGKENAELNKKLSKAEADYDKMFWNKNEIISKAKEIIKMLHSDCYSIAECEDTNLGPWEDDLAKAEQFLSEVSE